MEQKLGATTRGCPRTKPRTAPDNADFANTKRAVLDVCRVYRLDYDIAVGVSQHTAKDTALCETNQPTEPMPYSSPDQFAVWCKTLLNPTVDSRAACALAAARMMGRVWAWVRATDELTRGDHVAWNSGKICYYQHAIVTHIEGILIYVRTYIHAYM